jgi:hypothetical protein
MVELLAAVAVLVAWAVFRLDRHAQRQSVLQDARARLLGVQHGMVEGDGDQPGWGEVYFAARYAGLEAVARAEQTRSLIRKGGIDQVFVVPTEPVARLATARGVGEDLISERTIAAASILLWRLHVFNQLVGQLSRYNAQYLAEIIDEETPPERREVLAHAGFALSRMLHGDGIGTASEQGGWYAEFKAAVASDIKRLRDLERFRWPGDRRERHLAVGDLLAAAFMVFAVVDALCGAI